MSFLVLRSGIYYFRKTYVLPEGKRKEIKLSLKTRDKQLAQYLAFKMLYEKHAVSRVVPAGVPISTDLTPAIPIPAVPADPLPPSLDNAIVLFIAENARSGAWKEREKSRVGTC